MHWNKVLRLVPEPVFGYYMQPETDYCEYLSLLGLGHNSSEILWEPEVVVSERVIV